MCMPCMYAAQVRSMGAAAVISGRWQVGVVNMRSCGAAPVTSPRFFSAFRGATDDVRVAIAHVRKQLHPDSKVAVVGWSNGATILNNFLAEQASTHKEGRASHGADAGVTLACPLNMPLASGNLKRWFHSNVYDRAIARYTDRQTDRQTHTHTHTHIHTHTFPSWAPSPRSPRRGEC
jgi:predicted alpha/beta-fold hydrolase